MGKISEIGSGNMRIKKVDLLNYVAIIVLFLYLFFSNLSNHNIYSDIAILVLFFFSAFLILFHRRMYFNKYFVFYLVFVIYQFLLILFGQAYDNNSTLKVVSTLMINFSILLLIYNVIIHVSNMEIILKVYAWTSIISLALIMFLLRDSLFVGRLAHAYGEGSVSFYFLGKPIGISSNGIAFYAAVSALFCFYFLIKTKKIGYLVLILFLSFGCVMTGSRKGILVLVFYFALAINYFYKGSPVKKAIIASLLFAFLYLIVMKIPALYTIVGSRIEAIVYKMMGKATSEGSIVARERYKAYALRLIPKELFFGYGCGYFSHIYGNVTEINYLEMLMSGGIVGIFIYYLNYLVVAFRCWKNRLYLSDITKILIIVFISIFIYDIGSVTYSVRNVLIVVIMLLGSLYLDIRKRNLIKNNSNVGNVYE